MINSNHFDAGYADLTINVINEYFHVYFPRAASVGQELRDPKYANQPGAGPLKWMTFSYMISLFFDCPPAMGLQCPNQTLIDIVTNAIREQDIVWNAFPFNAELATGDASLITAGIELSQALKTRFNTSGAMTKVLSTRDVPGMPRAVLPILKEAGIVALSEGMNGRMLPVNVPPAFRWQAQDQDVMLPTLWHWGGYGQPNDPGNPVLLPNTGHVIAYAWRGDNEGPPETAREVLDNARDFLQRVQEATKRRTGLAGGATGKTDEIRVVSSTLADVVQALDQDDVWNVLPVVTQDLSDTWIWGVGQDPVKMARMRSIARARTACELNPDTAEMCSSANRDYLNFTRLALKTMEHTWGLSAGHLGPEADRDWSNAALQSQLTANQSNFRQLVQSWQEQRVLGIDDALSALPEGHPAQQLIQADFAEMRADPQPDPAKEGLAPVADMTSPVPFGSASEGLSGTVTFAGDGSIIGLKYDSGTPADIAGPLWASPDSPLGLFRYQTLVYSQFDAWHKDYLRPNSGGFNYYGKPESFMQAVPTPEQRLVAANLTQIWAGRSETVNTTVIMLQLKANKTLHTIYGAPREIWIRYNLHTQSNPSSSLKIACRVTLLDKVPTRLPEAAWFSFTVRRNTESHWEHSILDEWSDPLNVATGASNNLHYVSEQGVRRLKDEIQIKSQDTGLLRWGEVLPYPYPLTITPDLKLGASFNLFNNIWNTNYPMWFPFDELGNNNNLVYRFEIILNHTRAQMH